MPKLDFDYESDHTRFIREFLQRHPEEVESQRKGRAVWWDHEGDARTAPLPDRHAPKAGGNEYLFEPLSETQRKAK